MAQLQPPVVFIPGQVLAASALNAHVSSALLLPGSITDQTDIAENTVVGCAFTSAGGLTASVTSAAHGLSTGDQINVTASVTAFSGRQTITVTSVSTFTFTISQTVPAVASGTLDYTKVSLVASGDSLCIHDLSSTALKETTAGQLLNSGLNLASTTATIDTAVTSTVNGRTNKDINLTPNDGIVITGKAFNSIDGITATVTSTAHGLETGMLLDITASNAVYTGQYFITVLSVDTFSFVISQTTPVAASGTVDYTKKGTVKTVGNQNISGKLNVAGTAKFNSGATIAGNLNVSGTTNFTGGLQIGGSAGYLLTGIVEQTVSPSTATSVANNYVVLFTSSSYTKPSDEIWHIEIVGALQYHTSSYLSYKLKRTSGAVDLIGTFDVDHAGIAIDRTAPLSLSAIENTGTSFTSTYTFEMAYGLSGYVLGVGQTTSVNPSLTATIPATKFRIYKYKTA